MNKYSVAQVSTTKTAGAGCPICGKATSLENNVLLCPEHGSKPWEKNAESDKSK